MNATSNDIAESGLASTAPAEKPRRRRVRLVLGVLVVLALAASIAGNALLFRQANANYKELSETQLDPYGLKHPDFPAYAPSADPSAPAFVFFGDSRARGWPAPAVSGYHYLNRGIGGQTTEQIRGRLATQLTPTSPKVVIVQAGINDLKAIAVLPGRQAEIVAACKANLREIVRRCGENGATVIVTTIFPPGDVPLERRMIWSPEIEKAVEEVNADLRTLASSHVLVLDAWKTLEDQGRLRQGYGVDTLHLSPLGYAALNVELEKLLRSIAQ